MELSLWFAAVWVSTRDPSTDANTVLRAAAPLAQRSLALYVGWSEHSLPEALMACPKCLAFDGFRARIPQKWTSGFAIGIRANLKGSIFYGKPASTLPENAPAGVRVCLPTEPYSFKISPSFTTLESYPFAVPTEPRPLPPKTGRAPMTKSPTHRPT